MSKRGHVPFKLGGIDFELVPSFENLDMLESVTNKPIYSVASQPKVSDAIKCMLACGKPIVGAHPSWFNADGIFERVNSENKAVDLCLALVSFCTNVLKAGSETDIKPVGADDSTEKK